MKAKVSFPEDQPFPFWTICELVSRTSLRGKKKKSKFFVFMSARHITELVHAPRVIYPFHFNFLNFCLSELNLLVSSTT